MKTVTFKKIELTDKNLLIAHLLNNPGILVNELRLITAAESSAGEFLAGTSEEKRLHIIEAVHQFDEGLLYRSLYHLQWMLKESALPRQQDQAGLLFDRSLRPGIIYVLPECPAMFLEIIKMIEEPIPVRVTRYLYLESEQAQGFFFESLKIKKAGKPQQEKALIETQIESLREQAGLTREEIMKFLS
jgi:hypothetical protein